MIGLLGCLKVLSELHHKSKIKICCYLDENRRVFKFVAHLFIYFLWSTTITIYRIVTAARNMHWLTWQGIRSDIFRFFHQFPSFFKYQAINLYNLQLFIDDSINTFLIQCAVVNSQQVQLGDKWRTLKNLALKLNVFQHKLICNSNCGFNSYSAFLI